MTGRGAWVQLAVVAAAIAVASAFGDRWQRVAVTALIQAIAAVGVTLVVARIGRVSLGHAAFYALGGYASGVLTRDHGWPIVAGIAAALVVGLAAGAIVGPCALRTRGIAFVMVTLAAGEVVRVFGQQARGITGGDTGLSGIPEISMPLVMVVAAAVLVAALAAMTWLLATTLGRSVDAARQDERKAAALGYAVMRSQIIVFVLSSGIVAVAGALFVHHTSFASPSLARWSLSGHFLVVVLIGGGRTLTGAITAAVGLTFLEEWVVSRSDHWELVLGLLFVFVVVGRDPRVTAPVRRLLARLRPPAPSSSGPGLVAR